MAKYKCYNCYIIFDGDTNECPECGAECKKMCPNDTVSCEHEVVESIAYCSECNEPVCPICNCHDVEQISRITGYMQPVYGWNLGKQQELRDRKRYDVV